MSSSEPIFEDGFSLYSKIRAPNFDPIAYTAACSQLRPSNLAAHNGADLVLLPSGPDTVRLSLLRKTQPSTPLTAFSIGFISLITEHHPRIADFGFSEEPLLPQLARILNYTLRLVFSQQQILNGMANFFNNFAWN